MTVVILASAALVCAAIALAVVPVMVNSAASNPAVVHPAGLDPAAVGGAVPTPNNHPIASTPAAGQGSCTRTSNTMELLACRSLWQPSRTPVVSSAKFQLGQILFFDPRLSGNNSTSCASCHNPALGWSDGSATPVRFPGVKRRTQSLWDVGRQNELFWDGRAASLEQQAASPMESPDEMDSSRLKVARIVSRDPDTRQLVEQIGGAQALREVDTIFSQSGFEISGAATDPGRQWRLRHDALDAHDKRIVDRIFSISLAALAEFQRSIVSAPAAFDRVAARSWASANDRPGAQERLLRRGMALFFGSARCVECHTGPILSDLGYHRSALPTQDAGLGATLLPGAALTTAKPLIAGAVMPACPPAGSGGVASRATAKRQVESGRAAPRDFYGYFRTPSLRNVATRPPYFHDGHATTLRDAVREELSRVDPCAVAQGRQPTWNDADVQALLTFLQALTSLPGAPQQR